MITRFVRRFKRFGEVRTFKGLRKCMRVLCSANLKISYATVTRRPSNALLGLSDQDGLLGR